MTLYCSRSSALGIKKSCRGARGPRQRRAESAAKALLKTCARGQRALSEPRIKPQSLLVQSKSARTDPTTTAPVRSAAQCAAKLV
jgi:hypothetical protein